MADEVEITLNGRHGLIDPMAVADALSAVDKMLRSFEGSEAPMIRLSDLHIGSAFMGVRADEYRVSTLNEGVEELRAGTGVVPRGWGTDSLRALLDLERVGNKAGVEGVRVQIGDAIGDIDRALAVNARALLDHSVTSLGAVRGTLYRYTNSPGRRTAGLREINEQIAIELVFPSRLATEIKSLLDHEVEVWGVMHRDITGVLSKVDVEGLEAAPVANEQLALDDVAGILGPDWTGGLGSVDWVRQQRG